MEESLLLAESDTLHQRCAVGAVKRCQGFRSVGVCTVREERLDIWEKKGIRLLERLVRFCGEAEKLCCLAHRVIQLFDTRYLRLIVKAVAEFVRSLHRRCRLLADIWSRKHCSFRPCRGRANRKCAVRVRKPGYFQAA